jgi:tRNA-specific 2-thiouridylase
MATLASDSRILAALSGGVDSAVAAAMMVSAGHRVVGVTMRLYDAKNTRAGVGRCCGPRDIEDARRVADHLGIPFYVLDFADDFQERVIDDFVSTYARGDTPNPCVRCNQYIKFTPLLRHARALSADAVVTGHYARLCESDGELGLYRGFDPDKDQSYFLFSMPREAMPFVRFPLGGLSKKEVRERAVEFGLPNAHKAESQEICFVPDGDYAGFVERESLKRGLRPRRGSIVSTDGKVLGTHDGLHRFTIGQRKGLGHLGDNSVKYVARLDRKNNSVVVGSRADSEQKSLAIADLRWLSDKAIDDVGVQVRYRARPIAARLERSAAGVTAHLSEPTAAAPGQAAVFYHADQVVGGGWIAESAA